jgi:TonB family protein
MPTSEAPTKVSEPASKTTAENGSRLVSLGLKSEWAERPVSVEEPPAGTEPESVHEAGPDSEPESETGSESGSGPPSRSRRGSRWVDYDTHELLEMIGELEDERRWARLREGIWLAILVHFLLLSAFTWIPKYIFHVAPVIDPIDAIKQRKDLTYLDLPPDALRNIQPKVQIKPVPSKLPRIDKKTLEAMNHPAPPIPAPAPEPPKATTPAPVQPPAPIAPAPQGQVEAPRLSAVPARPNFAMGSQNPADQLQQAMRGASRNQGAEGSQMPLGGAARHPGAGSGAQILSDTQGVDFDPWLRRWYFETEHTWDPLIPDEVNPPILKSGQVQIRFKVLPNGRVTDMQLEGRSGDPALDRAAWGAITGSNYPPLPHEFHGPYLELRAIFMYNMQPH